MNLSHDENHIIEMSCSDQIFQKNQFSDLNDVCLGQSEGNSAFREAEVDRNANALLLKKDTILSIIEKHIGDTAKSDFEKLILLFYSNEEVSLKINCLFTLALTLDLLNYDDLVNDIVEQLPYFLKKCNQEEEQYEFQNIKNIGQLKQSICQDCIMCSSLFQFISNNRLEYILIEIIEQSKIVLSCCDSKSINTMVDNKNFNTLNRLLKFQEKLISDTENAPHLKSHLFQLLTFKHSQKQSESEKDSQQKFESIRIHEAQSQMGSQFEFFLEGNFNFIWKGMLYHIKNNEKDYQNFIITKNTILTAIKVKSISFMREISILFSHSKIPSFTDDNIFYEMILLAHDHSNFSDFIFILSTFYKQIQKRQQQEFLIEFFMLILDHHGEAEEINYNSIKQNQSLDETNKDFRKCHLQERKANSSYLFYTLSPFISSTLISKMFYVLSQEDTSPLKQKMYMLSKHFLDLSVKFGEQLDDLRDWKILLFNITYPARKSLIQITQKYKHFFTPILSLTNIKTALFIKWKSEQTFSIRVWELSSLWNCFNLKYGQRYRDRIPPNYQVSPLSKVQEESSFQIQAFSNNMKNKRIIQLSKSQTQNISKAIEEVIDNVNAQEKGEVDLDLNKTRDITKIHSNKFSFWSKLNFFLWEGVYHINHKDVATKRWVFSKETIEKSVLVRNIIQLGLWIVLFFFCFAFAKQFIDGFMVFLSISDDYLRLVFQNIPPTQYQSIWEDKCKTFGIAVEKGLYDQYPIYDLSQVDENNNLEACQSNLIYVTCDTNELLESFLTDCQNMTLFLLMLDKISLIFKVSVGLLISVGVWRICMRVARVKMSGKCEFTFFEFIDYLISILASVITYQLIVKLDPNKYGNNQLDQHDLKNNSKTLQISLMYFFLLLWCAFFNFLRKSEKLGNLIKMFEMMIKDLVWFLLILVIALAAFSTFFYIGFGVDYNQYDTLVQTFISLISSLLGEFSISDKSFDAQIYLIIFLILFNIIILNILIATFSNTFNIATELGGMEHSILLYMDYQYHKFNPFYSSIALALPPLNIVMLPLLLIQLLYKSKKLNQISSFLAYLPLFAFFLSLFFGFSCILLPFAWVSTYVQILINYKKKFTMSFLFRVHLSFIWVIFGLPLLTLTFLLNDLPLFIKICFEKSNPENVSQKIFLIDQYEKVNIQIISDLLEYLESRSHDQKARFETDELKAENLSQQEQQPPQSFNKKELLTFLQGHPIHSKLSSSLTKDFSEAYNFNRSVSSRNKIFYTSEPNLKQQEIHLKKAIISPSLLPQKNVSCNFALRQQDIEGQSVPFIKKQDGSICSIQNNKSLDIIPSSQFSELYFKLFPKVDPNQKSTQAPSYLNSYMDELWLELFLKRISFNEGLIKISMIRSFLDDAKKSISMTKKKYSTKKILDKQSILFSLLDINLNQKGLQKFLSDQN